MTLELNSWEIKFILEALRTLDTKWNEVIDGTDDEDVQSEYGNDLAQLHLLRKRIEMEASKEFGPEVNHFSREPIGVTPKE